MDVLDYNTMDGNLMGYSSFELADYRFEAWQPGNNIARREWVLRVYRGDGVRIREETVRMHYPNHFGPDIADIGMLNQKVEEVIKELGLE